MNLHRKKDNKKTWWKFSLSRFLMIIVLILMVAYIAIFYRIITNKNSVVLQDETLISNSVSDHQSDVSNLNSNQLKTPPKIGVTGGKVEEMKVVEETTDLQQVDKQQKQQQQQQPQPKRSMERLKLRAFIENTDQSKWEIKPLPVRTTKSNDLKVIEFDNVSSCKKLPEQWPVDDDEAPTNKDPFLPWIHDVFPTADGKYIQFVAQNRRRCQSGKKKTEIKKFMQPNIALFQHVPIKRIQNDNDNDNETKYRISSHEEADKDAIETRFICRFKPSGEETLSVFNFNYDYHTLRKKYSGTFTEEGFDNHMIWSSQLLFRCPVPQSLQEDVKSGKSVIDDYASLYVDLIPIRTPPRYGLPTQYLPPRLFDEMNTWDAEKEWGKSHILPKIEDSGRWENIPICKPSLMTYPDEAEIQSIESADMTTASTKQQKQRQQHDENMVSIVESGKKKHELIACTWTSAAFKTRGDRTSVNDGQERLLQWLEFNKLVGVDHVYIYDNSGANSETMNLKPITDRFPGYVTRVNWPARVCNNNKGNMDNKGERSSQYAADASCRLRFGSHSTWLASYDTDEYIMPLEKYSNLKELLRKVEKENIKILKFQSKRSLPRLRFLDSKSKGDKNCKNAECFDPAVRANNTFLEVYNCNKERPPRKDIQPAEKVIYKTDYVLSFFVHYATITTLSAMGKKEAQKKGIQWFTRYNTRRYTRFVDETTEGTMLHTKAIVAKETNRWRTILTNPVNARSSMIGVEWPPGKDESQVENERSMEKSKVKINGASYYPNCYPVEWIEKHWSPKLNEALQRRKDLLPNP